MHVTDYPVKVGKPAPRLQAVAVCVLTYADVCWRALAYADVR